MHYDTLDVRGNINRVSPLRLYQELKVEIPFPETLTERQYETEEGSEFCGRCKG